MGFVDKAKDLLSGHDDQVKDGIDRAADMGDEKTGGKYTDKIDMGTDKLKDGVDSMSDDPDDQQPPL